MALVLYDRVQQTGTANTTVSFTLSGSVTGYQSFSVVGNGNTTYYGATDTTGNWEAGIGTYATGGTLTRTTILASSNSGSAVTFSGTVTVFVTYPAEKSVNLDSSGNVSPLGTIASGTWQGSTVGVAYGGTGVTASSGANSVVLRDANQNIYANSVTQELDVTTSAGGTTVLTLASSHFQILTGSTTQTFQLPDATTLPTGSSWIFDNDSTGNLYVVDAASGAVDTVAPGGYATVFLELNGTVAGTWGRFGMIPSEVDWGTNSLNLNSTVITGGTWNGGTIASGYGGTGLTTFTGANNALYSTSSSALTAGTLPVAAGGTGATTLTGYVYGNGTSAMTASTTIPTSSLSGSINLATQVTGTLPIANGGTGQTTAGAAFNALSPITTTGDLIVGNGSNSATRLGIGSSGQVLTVSGGTATWSTPSSGGGTITTTDFTATAGQTTFSVTYTVGLVEVYQNGSKLANADYTATNGTSIILATAASAGDVIEVVAFSSLNIYSTITSETFSGTGSQTVFTMSTVPANTASVLVAISGVVQDPTTYSVSSNTLTFSTAPPAASGNISVRYLGVASVGTVGSFSAGTTGFTPSSATTGAVTLAGTLNVANGGTGVTTSTGSGSVVLSTSPTLVTPVLGTPTSGTLTNCTGLPLTGLSSGVTGVSLGAGNASIMKNRIINGAMVIDQRNAGASVSTSSGTEVFSLDRWKGYYSATSKFTIQQNAGSVTPPAGFTNYLGITSSSSYSVSSTDYFNISQPIEGFNVADLGWGTANAKTVTLSFWVRSSLTGTFGGSIANSSVTRSYPFTYSISSANTWEQKSVTIAGDTSGTWLTNNGVGVYLLLGLGAGSSVSGTAGAWAGAFYWSATGATSVVGTNGATFYITGVQLEVGSSATGFEYVNYQTSLANCQRYYEVIATGANKGITTVNCPSSTTVYGTVPFKVSKRTNATLSYVSGTNYYQAYIAGNSGFNFTSMAQDHIGTEQSSISATVNSGTFTGGQCGYFYSTSASGFVAFSAEL